ncbi:hypothetical protein SAMN04487839_11711 [Streptococcus gallolyticus]|uniref:ABC transporter permease n=1 Tax=Streptococcus gallolyticus TaxID=315405 RepID=A0A1H9SSC2_9STRE|nr:ABC transporter permease [Streptococcus gallolyticus]SEF22664.1 hypothetical protein SAMN02910295_1431 [Streptococcus gallolyticus]SEM35285.1 hypothetical protein SAMN04487839_11711 [Streptococcus gallolyticus]SER87715.1 hypothetical protein SAMN04487840_1117 [Streptococcus gallolyticus]
MKELRSEIKKYRRSRLWLPILGLFLFSIYWCSVSNNIHIDKNSSNIFQTLIFNIYTINNLIIPFSAALLASRMVTVDRNTRMYSVLFTNGQNEISLFLSKYVLGLLILFLGFAIQLIFIFISSKQYNTIVNNNELILFVISMLLGSGTMLLIQLLLSFVVKSVNIPIVIGLAGSFLSLLTSGALPKQITIFIPWEYLSTLNPYTINDSGIYSSTDYLLYFSLVLIIHLLLLITSIWLVFKERIIHE